jgi:hypothetical protein
VIGTTQFAGRAATSSALALCNGHRYISADPSRKTIQARIRKTVLVKQTQSWRRAPHFPTPPTP